jgi:tRNA nucleotidyltransferase (CCA-adding enzyme)
LKIEKNKYDFRDISLFLKLFGDRVFAVGGFVRDIFLYNKRDDIDLLILKEEIDSIIEKLKEHGKIDIVGKNFGIILFIKDGINYEIALPRIDITDKSKKSNHKNFIIKADPDIPIAEDLKRRDFVCNSMALNLKTGELIDPFGGLKDIENRILRMTNENSFFDDPLRILRGARFAATLNFDLEKKIYDKANRTDLTGLSRERIIEELFKMIIRTEFPSRGFVEYFKLGVLKQLFPEIYKMTLTIQDSDFHPETDEQGHHTVWKHTLLTMDNIVVLAEKERFEFNTIERMILVLSALMHDIGKVKTTEWNWKRGRMTITSNNHDFVGSLMGSEFFKRFNISSYRGYDIKELIVKLIKFHHRINDYWKIRDEIGKKTIAKLYLEFKDDIKYLILLDVADKNGRGGGIVEKIDERGEWLLKTIKEYNINKETVKPIIMGRDLIDMGVSSGPMMGKILSEIYDIQIDDGFKDREEGLLIAKDIIKKYIK